jgi:hypothetical protein
VPPSAIAARDPKGQMCDKLLPVSQDISPQQVTKPIQLLAAWLIGLISIDAAFLASAKVLTSPSWAPAALVVAAICNVPLFLVALFLLQTKFRPEMQEDSFYARYLEVQSETRSIVNPAQETAELRQALTEANQRMTEVLREVSVQISTVRATLPEHSAENVQRAVESTKHIVDQAAADAFWRSNAPSINDRLPQFRRIFRALNDAGVMIFGIFGSASDLSDPPKYSVMTVRGDVAPLAVSRIAEVLTQFGDWYLNIVSEPVRHDRIFIGAYGYGGRPVVLISPDVLVMLKRPDTTIASLRPLLTERFVHLDADHAGGEY